MEILSHSRSVKVEQYSLCFDYIGASKHHGFSFDCNAAGEVDVVALQKKPAAYDNYLKCLSGEHKVHAPYVQDFSHRYTEPAVGRCVCGCKVELARFTNTCDGCNRDYNYSGDLLAHRSQWGEETGESYCDIQDL